MRKTMYKPGFRLKIMGIYLQFLVSPFQDALFL